MNGFNGGNDFWKNVTVLIAIGAAIVGITVAIYQRPTEDKASHMIEEQVRPLADAFNANTAVLKELAGEVTKLREQRIRDEWRWEHLGEKPPPPLAAPPPSLKH